MPVPTEVKRSQIVAMFRELGLDAADVPAVSAIALERRELVVELWDRDEATGAVRVEGDEPQRRELVLPIVEDTR